MITDTNEDDGSLAFLNISAGFFDCKQTTQTELINTTFWVVDYDKDVPEHLIKDGQRKYVLKIKMNLEDSEREAMKFFSSSNGVVEIIDKIAELNAFPRKVTLKKIGKSFRLV